LWALHFNAQQRSHVVSGIDWLALLLDDALVVLEKHLPVHGRKENGSVRCRPRSYRGYRARLFSPRRWPGCHFVPVSFMSSIAGRFLYQFGITAAAAVMVSMLVSFTLDTHDVRANAACSDDSSGGHDAAQSRQGFYRWIDASYMAT
jgi:HAE1 family hydrophobic/amphiphilic exporter-1